MATAVNQGATGNPYIDGVLSGVKWSGTVTYSFPDLASDYPASYSADNEPLNGFAPISAAQQTAVHAIMQLIVNYTNLTITFAGTNGADIRLAHSNDPSTAWAYYPSNDASGAGGDVWFGNGYTNPVVGNYEYLTHIHEIGHSFGLKHGQEVGGPGNVAVPADRDALEYTVMTYRSYEGGPLNGYTNEQWGYPQTFMMSDIAALQTMYGADFNYNSGNTVYSWTPGSGITYIDGVAAITPGGNRIFMTVWDGGGVDTYDFSAYSTSVTIDLGPGDYSIASSAQLAYLGNGNYAHGNVYNAYLFQGNPGSYIENAIGGSGNDFIYGNDIDNVLTGNGGNDTLYGLLGNDTLNGGAGNDFLYGGDGNDTLFGGPGIDTFTGGVNADTFVFAAGDSSAASGQQDLITDFTSGTDRIDLSSIDAISSTPGIIDAFNFLGSAAFNGVAGALNYFFDSVLGITVLQGDTNGDMVADFAINLTGNIALVTSDLLGINLTPTVIESSGSTYLTEIGNQYYLYNSGSSGPTLKYGGADVVAGQFGGFTPIGAEAIAGGYKVAWKMTGADQYTIWTTDSAGNYLSYSPVVSGSDNSLKAIETSFQQDLNGDGVIGSISATVIDTSGATHLTQVGNHFYLYDSGASGPSLKFGGTDVVEGQFGGFAPIGAEAIAGGYKVAWKMAGADQYTIWTTDSAGNYISYSPVVSGSAISLKFIENSFQQDLNGDGVIGIPGETVIETSGSTWLTQVGNNFELFNTSGSGPSLKFGGADVVAGQFGGFVPIGAETIAGGYKVAWKMTGADQYTIWTTDSNGNYISHSPVVSGADSSLQAIEASFQQDLNGDGVIGLPGATVIESSGSTYLTDSANDSHFYDRSASDPSLKFGGADVVAGQFGSFVPIGAEVTAGGYEVAWKMAGADQYTIWTTDSNGNYISYSPVVPGADSSLQAIEASFQQNLNGDGHIGLPETVISGNETPFGAQIQSPLPILPYDFHVV